MTLSDGDLIALSPAERRERNRQQMIASILAAARTVMQEGGVAALNLNEVARRVQLKPQSLAEYFPNKAALYDALFAMALDILTAADLAAYRDHAPGWDQVEAWFANRLDVALANPDLYHLTFDRPVPDYTAKDDVLDIIRTVLDGARAMVANGIAAGAFDPGIPVEQATDVLLAFRRGLVAERLGKRHIVDPTRFQEHIPVVISILKRAWDPASFREGAADSVLVNEGGAATD